MEKKKLKKKYKIAYIVIIAALAVISVLYIWKVYFYKPPLPEAHPVNGFIERDLSMLFLSGDYSVAILPKDCEGDLSLNLITTQTRSLDAVIASSPSDAALSALDALLKKHPIKSVFLPSGIDKGRLHTWQKTYTDVSFKSMSWRDYYVCGDMLLHVNGKSSFTLTHGENTVLYATDAVKDGKYQLSILPRAAAVDSGFASDCVIMEKDGAGAVTGISSVNYKIADMMLMLYSDGTEIGAY